MLVAASKIAKIAANLILICIMKLTINFVGSKTTLNVILLELSFLTV